MNEIPKIITTEVVNPEKQEVRERVHERVISGEERDQYAKLTGDYNPIHFGEGAICHGMHVASLVSGAVTEEFGNGTRVMGDVNINFRASIPIGTPFKIIFEEPESIEDSHFGESKIFAVVAKQVVINGTEGPRYTHKKAMTAVFRVILPKTEDVQ